MVTDNGLSLVRCTCVRYRLILALICDLFTCSIYIYIASFNRSICCLVCVLSIEGNSHDITFNLSDLFLSKLK